MRTIDLNADIGEADTKDWRQTEANIMAQISSANIACGAHAGNNDTMALTVKLARDNNVNIGAHPAYPDRDNFGRRSLKLGQDISVRQLEDSLSQQIVNLAEIAARHGKALTYVKPHGALYNDAVFNPELAQLLTKIIAHIDPTLWLMGAPNSQQKFAADKAGLKFIAEGFIDRRYTDDGHLLSRSKDGAILQHQDTREAQAISLLKNKSVMTHSGQKLALNVHTLCLHSDSPGADMTARHIRKALENSGAIIKPFTHAS